MCIKEAPCDAGSPIQIAHTPLHACTQKKKKKYKETKNVLCEKQIFKSFTDAATPDCD